MTEQETDTIEAFLDKYGWKYIRHSDDIIVTAFEVGEWRFDLNVYLFDDWIQIEIPDFLQTLPEGQDGLICDSLLAYNGEMIECRFSIEEDGSVSLAADLTTECLEYETFAEVLDLLTVYSEQYIARITELIQ